MPQLILFGLPPTLPDQVGPGLAREFGELLSERLGAPVDVRICANYSELSDRLAEGDLDFAWLPPLPAAGLRRHCGISVLTHAVRAGLHAYYSVIFVREDSPIEGTANLAGRRMGYVHRRSASGFLVAAATLSDRGIETAAAPQFLKSHARVVDAVQQGVVEAGATFCNFEGDPDEGVVTHAGFKQGGTDLPMRIVLRSDPIPADVICAWPGTQHGSRARMTEALVGLGGDERGRGILDAIFGAERFDVTDMADLDRLDFALEAPHVRLMAPSSDEGDE
jgi:phosphate/phosphite/phosphonate ABC transporter binding protein